MKNKISRWGELIPFTGKIKGATRCFRTGATRDNEKQKIDPEGFINPLVIQAYCEYMHKHRIQAGNQLRDSDNWQKLFDDDHYAVCMKSLWRHFLDLWLFHRGFKGRETKEDALAGIMFNAMAYWYKLLINKNKKTNEKTKK